MKIYLDMCCFNRPFDDQSQFAVRLETEAKLHIQEDIRAGKYELIWSYILDFENFQNPFLERKEQINTWRLLAKELIVEYPGVVVKAKELVKRGVKKLDALHIACALYANASFSVTTDAAVIRKMSSANDIAVTDPIEFIKETES
jgi:hypothetical protein